VSNRGLVVPVDGRRMISTVVGVILVAAGALLRFAVPATSIHGLDTHVASIVVMLAGILGLLMSLLLWGPLGRRRDNGRRDHDRRSGRGAPPPGSGIPARTGRYRRARRSRDRESAPREDGHQATHRVS
jgi:hypothetical protein